MASVRYTRNLFLRGMSIIYLFAFLSFYYQIAGLYGDNGVLPARSQLDLQSKAPLLQNFKQKPTLLWFAPYLGLNVEYMLDVLSLIGIVLSFLGFISQKFCSSSIFAALWMLYFSLYQVGQVFMQYQWDNLLLEAGFLCIIVAPFLSDKYKKSTPSDSVTFWAVRWLFFRLLFSTGAVKLLSGCPVWWGLDALSLQFQSQTLPTPLAWYSHHLPGWYLRLTTALVNVLELVIPFLFFVPIRKIRVVAFYLEVFLQTHIIATGNYSFFNLLVICLSISLLDDQFFYRKKSKSSESKIWSYLSTISCVITYGGIFYGTWIYYNLKLEKDWTISSKIGFTPAQFDHILVRAIPISIWIAVATLGYVVVKALFKSMNDTKGVQNKIKATLTTILYSVMVIFILVISVVPYVNLTPKLNSTLRVEFKQLHHKVDQLHLVNSYGLFKKMTGVEGRKEILIEGSNNIEGPWKEYNFLYKPGNINSSLPFVAPHSPRLDWQMWFAAITTYHQNPWMMSLVHKMLLGQPEVLALLNNAQNPFRDNPPKYIRASLYHYHYTPWNSQSWWKRERVDEYLPIYSKDHPPLLEYLQKMKVIPDKAYPKVTNSTFKLVLDFIRSLVNNIEATLLLWGVFMAGCVIIMTG